MKNWHDYLHLANKVMALALFLFGTWHGLIDHDKVDQALKEYTKQTGTGNLVLAAAIEDLFDYSDIDESAHDPALQQQYAQVAINAINKINDPYQAYEKYFGRCQANKPRFHGYVYDYFYGYYLDVLKSLHKQFKINSISFNFDCAY